MSVWFTLNPWRPGNKQPNKSVNKNACEWKGCEENKTIRCDGEGAGRGTAFSFATESEKVSQGHGTWAKAWMMAGVSQVEMKGDGSAGAKALGWELVWCLLGSARRPRDCSGWVRAKRDESREADMSQTQAINIRVYSECCGQPWGGRAWNRKSHMTWLTCHNDPSDCCMENRQ